MPNLPPVRTGAGSPALFRSPAKAPLRLFSYGPATGTNPPAPARSTSQGRGDPAPVRTGGRFGHRPDSSSGKALPPTRSRRTRILAAGASGWDALLSWPAALAAEGIPTTFLAGFRTASAIPAIAFPQGAVICTDDGSAGFAGRPPIGFRATLKQGRPALFLRPRRDAFVHGRYRAERDWQASLSRSSGWPVEWEPAWAAPCPCPEAVSFAPARTGLYSTGTEY